MGFEDPTIALRTRDALERMVIKALDQHRPLDRFGTVVSINYDAMTCQVRLRPGADPVPARMGAVQPSKAGQTVRLAVGTGGYTVVDVVGAAYVSGEPSSELTAPSGFTAAADVASITSSWSAVAGAARYEVQIANNNTFSSGLISAVTVNAHHRSGLLEFDTPYYVRVRALTQSGASGPWSATRTVTLTDPFGSPSDGNPPSTSPQAVVTGNLGWLLVEWVAVPNADLVVYDVHLSTESGFAPNAGTYIGSTTGTFYSIGSLPGGAGRLEYDVTYFVRIVARDPDGAAAAGPQGFDTVKKVETGDAGNIGSGAGDGNVPTSSPEIDGVIGGIGYLYAHWSHIVNSDPVTYDVHIFTNADFIPDANTLVHSTPSNFTFIRTLGPGLGRAPLEFGTTYYLRIVARDADGFGPGGPVKAGQTVQANTADIAVGSITAGSAIIADAAIGSAKIVDAAITNAKIADAAISSAKIQDAQITSAKIADLAVSSAKIVNGAITTAKIADAQITDAKIASLSANKITAGTMSADRISGGTITGITISGSTITGGVIRTAASGARFQIDSQLDTAQYGWARLFAGNGGVAGKIGMHYSVQHGTGMSIFAGGSLSPRDGSDPNSNGSLWIHGQSELILHGTSVRLGSGGGNVNVPSNTSFTHGGSSVLTAGSHSHGTWGSTGGSGQLSSSGSGTLTSGGPSTSLTEARAPGTTSNGNDIGGIGPNANNHTHRCVLHSHTVNSHTHGLNSHTHSIGSHFHTVASHNHSFSF